MKNIALLASHPHRTYTQHYIGVGSIEYPTRNIVFAFVKCRNLLFCASFSGYERVSDSFTWSVLFCISIDRFGCYSGLDPYNYYPNQPFRCFIFPQNKKKNIQIFHSFDHQPLDARYGVNTLVYVTHYQLSALSQRKPKVESNWNIMALVHVSLQGNRRWIYMTKYFPLVRLLISFFFAC